MLRMVFILMLAVTFGCRSSDKPEETSEGATLKQAAPGQQTPKPETLQKPKPQDNPACAQRPVAKACCEALTPSCNDCRDENEKAQKDWENTCLAETSLPPKCDKPPPVSDCCPDYTDECEECRQKAAADLLAWKSACGTYEAHSCEAQPPTSMCCQAMIPSCQQCKDRNRRIVEEWQERCSGSEKDD